MTYKFLHLLVMIAIMFHENGALRIKFTKLDCNLTLEPEFGRGDACLLKPVSRNVQYLQFGYTVFQVPVTEFKIRVQIMTRRSGWQPFLYDVTVDCYAMKHVNVVTKLVWDLLLSYSNIRRHPCPYNETVYKSERIYNTMIEESLKLPVPSGDYGVFITVDANKKYLGLFNIFATLW